MWVVNNRKAIILETLIQKQCWQDLQIRTLTYHSDDWTFWQESWHRTMQNLPMIIESITIVRQIRLVGSPNVKVKWPVDVIARGWATSANAQHRLRPRRSMVLFCRPSWTALQLGAYCSRHFVLNEGRGKRMDMLWTVMLYGCLFQPLLNRSKVMCKDDRFRAKQASISRQRKRKQPHKEQHS